MTRPLLNMRRVGAGSLVVLLIAVAAASLCCSIRGNPLIRAVFYPPEVDMRPQQSLPVPGGQAFDHSPFAEVLRTCVDENGHTRYDLVHRNGHLLSDYLRQLSLARTESLDAAERLALYLNAYNAFTMKLILLYPGVSSIREIPAAKRWKDERWQVGGSSVSLDQLEHDLIRAAFREPRVHFALVCASKGCPMLRREPYTGRDLDAQLTAQARAFFSKKTNLQWDPASRTLHLSEIMDWFRGDFQTNAGTIPHFVARFVEPQLAQAILQPGVPVRLEFIPFDWRLNGVRRKPAAAGLD